MRQRKIFFNLTQFWFKTESMNRNTDGLKIEKNIFHLYCLLQYMQYIHSTMTIIFRLNPVIWSTVDQVQQHDNML